MVETCETRATFTNKLGFILAAAGSAVGLGNLWRFPYLAETYGGGAFLITYIILMVTFGFTLMITEIAIGRRTGKSCVTAFGEIKEKHRWIGWLAALVPIIIVPYYCVIGGWVLKYFFEFSFMGTEEFIDYNASNDFFNGFISADFGSLLNGPFIWFLIFVVAVIICVAMGVEKGVEKVSKVLMPMLLILLVGITVFTLLQPNSIEGLRHYLVPQLSDFNTGTLLGAMGQLFYSMSLAMGIMITYGSYMKKDENIEKSVWSIGAIDTGVALLAGMMIIPAVVIFVPSSIEFTAGPGLMFKILPLAFVNMGAAGRFVGMAFFLLTFFAALTSAISLAETVVSELRDQFNGKKVYQKNADGTKTVKKEMVVSRKFANIITFALILGLGFLSCYGYGPLSFGTYQIGAVTISGFLDLFDWLSNYLLMPIVAIITCLFVGYVVKPKFIIEEVESSAEFKFKKPYLYLIKYVCPVLLVIVLFSGLFLSL